MSSLNPKLFKNKTTHIKLIKKFDQFKLDDTKNLIIYDKILLRNTSFSKWIRTQSLSYGVIAGESLKQISEFSKHIEKIAILTEGISPRQLQIVAVGGGSVGDFTGFVASIYKRGVSLIQCPSTWLAAMDSAHGGKNALNLGSIKNQIGTFYFPKEVVLIEELLKSQPEVRLQEAFGEFFKMVILDEILWKKSMKMKDFTIDSLWKILPEVIKAKYRVVARDPLEQKGFRQNLNLGHTLGHVFESCHGLSHGVAINFGLTFALQYSSYKGILSEKQLWKILEHPLASRLLTPQSLWPTNKKDLLKFKKTLLADKKSMDLKSVNFIFIKKPGKVFRKTIDFESLFSEIERQSSEYRRVESNNVSI
ncbi:MAG TPA: hypothetical protein PLJ21_00695 [Pseudobdellovibrionaceae bacterium]|nr:hypothetical protein [Pseudobdellovibrionaceae bacterium]